MLGINEGWVHTISAVGLDRQLSTLNFASSLRQSLITQRLTDPELWATLDGLKQKFKVMEGEIVSPEGFQQNTNTAFDGQANLASRPTGMSVVDDHPIGLLV